ncbi:MAG: hypothetical protein AAF824_09385 [Bacteroidota bacterium]
MNGEEKGELREHNEMVLDLAPGEYEIEAKVGKFISYPLHVELQENEEHNIRVLGARRILLATYASFLSIILIDNLNLLFTQPSQFFSNPRDTILLIIFLLCLGVYGYIYRIGGEGYIKWKLWH